MNVTEYCDWSLSHPLINYFAFASSFGGSWVKKGGSCCLVPRHCLELTQAAVGWFVSVVIWQVTDKSKHSESRGIVHGREISWELSADTPPPPQYTFTTLFKHRQDCLTLVSIHFFRCLIVGLWPSIVQVVWRYFRCCAMWQLLFVKLTVAWQ